MVEQIVYWNCPYCGAILNDQDSECCGCAIKYMPRETECADNEPFILCNFDLIDGKITKIY